MWTKDETCDSVCSEFVLFFPFLFLVLSCCCLVGACCGDIESNGCVDNVQYRNCDASSEWTKDETCDNVCSN